MTTDHLHQSIASLDDIRRMKASLRTDLQEEERQVVALWQKLVNPPEPKGLMTPTKRMTNMLGTSMNVIDGLLLGWKLYRKFGGKRRLRF